MNCFIKFVLKPPVDGGFNSFKRMLSIDPVSAIASVGSSLLGGIFGASSQESANKSNERIARENLAWQTDENQKNRDFQERMWNEQNLYNTPSAMMARNKEAGLNPYLVGDNASAQSAGSVGSPSMVGAPNLPMMQPVNYGAGVGNAFRGLLEAMSVDANVSNQSADTSRKLWETAAFIYKNIGKEAYNKFVSFHPEMTNPSDPANSLGSREVSTKIFQMQQDANRNAVLTQFEKEWNPKLAEQNFTKMEKEMLKMDSEIGLMASQGKLNDASIDRMASELARNFAQAGYFNAMAGQITTLLDYVKTHMILTLGMQGLDYLNMKSNFDWEELVRDWKSTGFGKKSKLATFATDVDNNPVFKFMESFGRSIPSPLWNHLPQKKSSFTESGDFWNRSSSTDIRDYW